MGRVSLFVRPFAFRKQCVTVVYKLNILSVFPINIVVSTNRRRNALIHHAKVWNAYFMNITLVRDFSFYVKLLKQILQHNRCNLSLSLETIEFFYHI